MRIKKTVESLVAAVISTDVATIERELTKLEQRRAQLAETLDAATHNAIDASATRRELIIANRDPQALEKAKTKCREAEEQRVALDDDLRSLDQKIAETTKRLEAKDKAERDATGQGLEQDAAWTARVPAAVAEAAIEQGLALDADTAEARGKMKDMMERRPRRGPVLAVNVEDTIDLGVKLAEDI